MKKFIPPLELNSDIQTKPQAQSETQAQVDTTQKPNPIPNPSQPTPRRSERIKTKPSKFDDFVP
jgi:hypothetical protein